MEQTTFDYKKNRAELFLKYHVDLDETSSTILFILKEEQKKFFAEQGRQLEEATRKINSSNTSLQIDMKHPRSQAFWFGMGKWGLALIILTCIATFFYAYHLNKEEQDRKTTELFKWYAEYYQVSQRASKKEITNFLKKYPMPN